MKKILSITVMLLLVSLAFFSCTDEFEGDLSNYGKDGFVPNTKPGWLGTPSGPGGVVLPTFDKTDATEIGAMLVADVQWSGPAASCVVTKNAIKFDLSPSGANSDGAMAKLTLPASFIDYSSLQIDYEVTSVSSDWAGGGSSVSVTIKDGANNVAQPVLGEEGDTGSFTIAVSKFPKGIVTFNLNRYDDNFGWAENVNTGNTVITITRVKLVQ